jgi:hypothetical protein
MRVNAFLGVKLKKDKQKWRDKKRFETHGLHIVLFLWLKGVGINIRSRQI